MLKKYKDLRIASKLIIGFIIVAFLAAVTGVVGVVNISTIGEEDLKLYEKDTVGLNIVATAEMYYQRIRFNVVKAIITEESSQRKEILSVIDDYTRKLEGLLTQYEETLNDQTDLNMISALKSQWKDYLGYANNVFVLMNLGNTEEAKNLVLNSQTAADALQSSFDDIFEERTENGRLVSHSNQQIVKVSMILMISIAAFSVIAAVLLGVAISRLISRPVLMMAGDAEKLALGDVEIASNSAIIGKDEIGRLTAAFVKMAEERKEQAREVQRLASGDLTVEFSAKSDKDILTQSLITLVRNLNDLVVSIQSSADQVASGANLVSNSSTALSQGATEQASSVQQLTASLQEIASQTALSAENAHAANQLAKRAKSDAESGNSQMRGMLSAMEDISHSSSDINKIIKVIDDIAFQTNILALNAAVEAARAGQYGKGFAVVAEEVRTLAAKSAQAARETTDLIEGSIRKVEIGTKIAGDTASALGNIVDEVTQATVLVDKIAAASSEQASAVEQINQGINQVSQVVQNNAATSEEGAAASEELSSQAQQLKENVSVFKIKAAGSVSCIAVQPAAGQKSASLSGGQLHGRSHPASREEISLGSQDFGKY